MYFQKPYPRKGIIENLKKELSRDKPTSQVLLSFIGDPYGDTYDNNEVTRQALEILHQFKTPVAILTKGGRKCLKDIEAYRSFDDHIQIGATLTFDNNNDSLKWEPGAAMPDDRLETLKTLHDEGIRTFASFEPVINPVQSLNLIRKSLEFIDVYKIGKINNFQGLDKTIEWKEFLLEALNILRPAGKQVYIKHDLRKAAADVKLYENEVLPDEHNVTWT